MFPSLSINCLLDFWLTTPAIKEPSAVENPESQLSCKVGLKGIGLKTIFSWPEFKVFIQIPNWSILFLVAKFPPLPQPETGQRLNKTACAS